MAHSMRVDLPDVPAREAAAGRIQYALSESAAGDDRSARREIDAGIAEIGRAHV